MRIICLFIITVFSIGVVCGQSEKGKHRFLNIGLAPGLNTNSINPKMYSNSLGINIFSSYAASVSGFNIVGISSFSENSSGGIHLAGVVNIVGGNRYEYQEYTELELKNLSSNFTGLQVAGIANVVTGDFNGTQISGGGNISSYGDLRGFQISGLVNSINGYSEGAQVSGLINISKKYITGVQLAGLMNSTAGELYGVQISLWNAARTLYGPKSDTDVGLGFQLGLVNIAQERMDGFQVGLINRGSDMAGFQLGLININGTSRGFPVGLLNLGRGRMGIKIWADNVALTNIHLLTGSKHISNSLIFGSELKGLHPYLIGYSLGHTSHIRPGKIFLHYEGMLRTMGFTTRDFVFRPIATGQLSFSFHVKAGIYISVGGGINYDPEKYLSSNSFFPAYSIGISALE